MKKKVKKVLIIAVILAIIIIFCLFLMKNLVQFKLIGDKEIYLNVNTDYFENGYEVKIFNKNYKNVKVTNNIDNSKLGNYYVKYTISILGLKMNFTRDVHVVDKEKPELVLYGDNYIYLDKDEKYDEPGYSSNDNLDGDITDKVKITSNVDSSKLGKYEIIYSSTDNAKNESIKTRVVEVVNRGLLTSSISDFWLKGSFEDVTLITDEKEYDYFKDIIFLGDSNTVFLNRRGNFIEATQTWGKFNLNMAEINSSTFTTYGDNNITTLDKALEIYNPKYLLVSVGIGSPLYMTKDAYVQEIQKFIDYMSTKHSNITYAFISILPITSDGSVNGAIQRKINEYNYYLLEICHQNHINYINFSDEIRDTNGYANKNYFDCISQEDCGFHLNNNGKEKFVNYIKHLNIERKIEK